MNQLTVQYNLCFSYIEFGKFITQFSKAELFKKEESSVAMCHTPYNTQNLRM